MAVHKASKSSRRFTLLIILISAIGLLAAVLLVQRQTNPPASAGGGCDSGERQCVSGKMRTCVKRKDGSTYWSIGGSCK